MHYRNLFFSILFFISLTGVQAQQRNYKNFTEDDGLPSSTVYATFQDSRGYLWFATDKGVSKYDGYGFTNFSVKDGLSDNEIFNFFEDSKGRIWLYTFNGAVTYYYKNKFFNSLNDTTVRRLDSQSMITQILEDRNSNLYISSYNDGFIIYNTSNNRIQRYFKDDRYGHLSNMLFGSGDTIKLIYAKGVYSFSIADKLMNEHEIKHIPLTNRDLYNSKIVSISDQEFWVSNEDIIYKSGSAYDSLFVSKRFVINKTFVNNLCTVDDEIWICTRNGAIKYSTRSKFYSTPILKNFKITSVIKDSEGNYWFTTLGSGVKYCSNNEVFSYSNNENSLLSENVNKLFCDPNYNILFTSEGNKVDYVVKTPAIKVNKINNNKLIGNKGINNIAFSNNCIWIASNYNLYRVNQSKIIDKMHITSKDILILNDTITLATPNGLYVFPISIFDKHKNQSLFLPRMKQYQKLKGRITKIYRDNAQNIWLATHNTVFVKKFGKKEFVEVSKLRGIQVTEFEEYNSQIILMATNGSGVICANFANDSLYFMSTSNGLSSNVCNGITFDKDSSIWIATNNGLNKVVGFPLVPKVEHYDTFDGLSSKVINDVLIINDTIWVATNKGLNFFDKNSFEVKRKPPRMQIESISVNNKLINTPQGTIELTSYQNDLIINYVGISINSGRDILYRYKLHNDAPWKYTENKSINFSSLSPGDYEFSIAASGKFGEWSNAKVLSIKILNPIWQTYWFITLSLLLILLSIGLIVRQIVKNQKLKSIQEQRVITSELKSLKAQINPHFVFNALNSIQGELLKKQPEVALNYLGKLGRLMRKVLDHSEQLYVSVSEEISIITDYLETERFKTGNKFDYSIEVSKKVDSGKMQIPSMIVQPFVENSIWHGFIEPNRLYFLTITFEIENDSELVVKIADNGIGRQRATELTKKSHHSKGLSMVSERFEALNFGKQKAMSFLIEDICDDNNEIKGTVVILRIPQS